MGGGVSFGVAFTWKLEVLAILKEGCKKLPPLKKGWMGATKFFTLS